MDDLNYDQRKAVGERLKQFRLKQNMSQDAFAKKLGLTTTYISRLENAHGNVGKAMLYALCDTFGLNREWLIEGKGEDMQRGVSYGIPTGGNAQLLADSEPDPIERILAIRDDPDLAKAVDIMVESMKISPARAWTLVIKEKLRNGR